MIWQDIVMMTATITMSAALVPQVYYGFRDKSGPIKNITTVPTFLGLFVMCYAMYTLSLYLSATVTFVTATLWVLFFVQHLLYGK